MRYFAAVNVAAPDEERHEGYGLYCYCETYGLNTHIFSRMSSRHV